MNLRHATLAIDTLLAGISTRDNGVLLSFVFHGLFESETERKHAAMDPQQGVTVEMFRRFISYFRKKSYAFLSPQDLLGRIGNHTNCVLITFDDGYYNNTRAVPVLEEFGVPAVFFISSSHVTSGKAFWWDIVHREMRKENQSESAISRAMASYKTLRTSKVETALRQRYGEKAMRPAGDLDRPFTPGELREFAKHPLVFMGNHTDDHAILTNYSRAEMREQVQRCQDAIESMTGERPQAIAYPNGNSSPEVHEAVRDVGLQLGFGARPGGNRLPLESDGKETLSLKRFTLWGDRSIDAQCSVSRSRFSLYTVLNDVRDKLALRN
jgi:peptidoglycan/xylan/chitin deacetylase (PgdA/CDA1 family)